MATSWQPESLILDEVMAVGDEAFRRKCQSRMEGFREKGTTTLLVTHDMNMVEALCSRADWLERGEIRITGKVGDVVAEYMDEKKN